MIAFSIPAAAVPFARAGSNGAHRFTKPAQAAFMQTVGLYASRAMSAAGMQPFAGPVEVCIRAVYPWPESWSTPKRVAEGRWKTSRGDLDNIIKILSDSMNGIVFKDDAQIASLRAQKLWGHDASVTVSVAALGDDTQ